MEKKNYKSINFLGYSIFSSNIDELLAFLLPSEIPKRAEKTQLVTVFTPNPEQIMEAHDNAVFKSYLAQANILIPDGIGLITAQRVMQAVGKSKGNFTQRITGIDLSEKLLLEAHQRNWRVLVIGGRDYLRTTNSQYRVQNVDIAWLGSFTENKPKKAKGQRAKGDGEEFAQDPMAYGQVIHWLPAYQDIRNATSEEETFVAQVLKTLQPEIVFVAFGAPYQEQWVVEHKALLESNDVKICMVVGGAFDVILGKLSRAPLLMQKLGFEWLFRLLQEPHRWKRQLKLLTFVKLVIKELG